MRSRRGPVVAGSAHRRCAARIGDGIRSRARGERALMSRTGLWPAGLSRADWPDARRLVSALHNAAPALLFGLRLWASVCLALYVAFWLELDNAYWAGTTAAIVCQPSLGASLRKGSFRMVGTVGGAVANVLLH